MEMLIAVTIFVVVSAMGANIFTNVSRMSKKVNLENSIYEDARYMMERTVKLLRENTIDYEEYFNRKVLGGSYGENYGYYAAMFYNPGSDNAFGAKCNDNSQATASCGYDNLSNRVLSSCLPEPMKVLDDSCIIKKRTMDFNSGINPYPTSSSTDPPRATAVCDSDKGVTCDPGDPDLLFQQKELYLIDRKGKTKYIIGKELITAATADPEYSLSMVALSGSDTNGNDISDTWACADGYDCPGGLDKDDLTKAKSSQQDVYKYFVPLTPTRSNVVDLKFYISPLEDPRKAFAETKANGIETIQVQPHVTVVLTVKPSAAQLVGYPGTPPEVTLQTTVSSRVFDEVKSFGS